MRPFKGKNRRVSDMQISRSIVEKLLGPYSVSEKKTFTGPILDWIGWEINLQMKTVTIADHNLYKTLYGFFNIHQDQQITVREVQRLASWSARYSLRCRYMRPFTYYLFQSIKGWTLSEATIKMEGSLWMVVQLWQIFLILCNLKPVQYARSIRSFAYPQSPRIWLSYDASLKGVGFNLYRPWSDTGKNSYGRIKEFLEHNTIARAIAFGRTGAAIDLMIVNPLIFMCWMVRSTTWLNGTIDQQMELLQIGHD